MESQGVKRKRTKNTSLEQLEIYLNFMEKDYAFRSNTINPTMDPNYITNKWEELTSQLNSIGTGPSLTVEEWEKRFLDWKYATKSKYRKLKYLAIKTGGGPETTIKLTELEERGLAVWGGKVSVEGAPNITTYEGIENEVEDILTKENDDPNILYVEQKVETNIGNDNQPNETTETTVKMKNRQIKEKKPKPNLCRFFQNSYNNSKQLTKTTEKFTKIVEDLANQYNKFEEEKINLKKRRLNF